MMPAIAPYYEPITVIDPCVGSGVMLLSAAAAIPRWCSDWGLVQYYGIDIDATCAQMARINTVLYGMNGTAMMLVNKDQPLVPIHAKGRIWDAVEVPAEALAALPEPTRVIYEEVKANPSEEHRLECRARLAAQQLSLFPPEEMPVMLTDKNIQRRTKEREPLKERGEQQELPLAD
jgi:hypothetical protein